MSSKLQPSDVAGVLASSRIVVACGPGGVGKTTTAAALGVAVALRTEQRVLVLTVDPARRLADALGLSGIGNDVAPVPPSFFDALSRSPKGTLSIAMLDASATWDALIRRSAASPEEAEEIVANPLYKNLTARFARGHEFIAMERLYELSMSGEFDLLILDTPPSQGAVDFLDAPTRMAEFFSSRLLSWLTAPLRSRLLNFASRPFTMLADRVLGTAFLTDTARFFLLLQHMYDGFVVRAKAVGGLLSEETTTFMIVTAPEEIPLDEATRLVQEIEHRGLHLGVMVANKVLPTSLADPDALALAHRLLNSVARADREVVAVGSDDALLETVLAEMATNFINYAGLASAQATQLERLFSRHGVTIALPHLLDDVVDLEGLATIGDLLFNESGPASST